MWRKGGLLEPLLPDYDTLQRLINELRCQSTHSYLPLPLPLSAFLTLSMSHMLMWSATQANLPLPPSTCHPFAKPPNQHAQHTVFWATQTEHFAKRTMKEKEREREGERGGRTNKNEKRKQDFPFPFPLRYFPIITPFKELCAVVAETIRQTMTTMRRRRRTRTRKMDRWHPAMNLQLLIQCVSVKLSSNI